jgi:protein-S-isoprenylcysteine O-methyltransferase Ste14
MVTMTCLVIGREEAYLERKFKDQYTGYKSHVRRWL